MKKRKLFIIFIIVLIIVLFIPIPFKLKDGGTVEYKAIMYKITDAHKIIPDGYEEGFIIELLGIEIYNNVESFVEVKTIEKKDVINEEGLLFTINTKFTDCVPVSISIYDNNKYVLYTSYKACMQGSNCNLMLQYLKNETGTYDYDVMKIIQYSKNADRMSFNSDNMPEYEIYTGKGSMFISDNNNVYLKQFLNNLNIDLKKCADKEYIK